MRTEKQGIVCRLVEQDVVRMGMMDQAVDRTFRGSQFRM